MLNRAEKVPDGCFIEVGVWQGGSAQYLARLAEEQKRQIFLYDTFEGIPYKCDKDKHEIGDFSDTDYEMVKKCIPYATVVKGIFPNSAVKMPPIAFAHIDCDQYQSTMDSLAYIIPQMVKGGIIWFDDIELRDFMDQVKVGETNGSVWAAKELFNEKDFEFYPGNINYSKAYVTIK